MHFDSVLIIIFSTILAQPWPHYVSDVEEQCICWTAYQ